MPMKDSKKKDFMFKFAKKETGNKDKAAKGLPKRGERTAKNKAKK
jgi:hypothetical protein